MRIVPLRKPEHVTLTAKQATQQLELKKKSAELLLTKSLTSPFDRVTSDLNLNELFSTTSSIRNTKSIGDYLCLTTSSQLVSDEHGKIADILLTVPPVDPAYDRAVDPMDGRHLTHLISLLWGSDSDRMFTMLCDPSQIQNVETWLSDLSIPQKNFSISISTFGYSIWAQDAYVAMEGENGEAILCEGVHFPRYADPTIADDVSAQTDKNTMQSYLYFQGGNILEVGDYILIGMDYIVENLGRAHLETEEKVLSAFEATFGKEIIAVGRREPIQDGHRIYLGGGHFQPIFHIDMYITPTGKKSINGKDIVVVGSPKLAREAIGEHSKATDFDFYFDECADQMALYFEVVRMPLLPTRIKFSGNKERFYYLSFNNALVENYGEVSNVYLPSFSQDVTEYLESNNVESYEGDTVKRKLLDDAARLAWENLGYCVHQMDGLEDLAIGWGSVHCITKTLKRN